MAAGLRAARRALKASPALAAQPALALDVPRGSCRRAGNGSARRPGPQTRRGGSSPREAVIPVVFWGLKFKSGENVQNHSSDDSRPRCSVHLWVRLII